MIAERTLDPHLSTLRTRVRQVDELLLRMAAYRTEICLRIGERKHEQGLQVRDLEVEHQLVRETRDLAVDCSLDPDFAENFIRVLVEYSVKRQLEQRGVSGTTLGLPDLPEAPPGLPEAPPGLPEARWP